ncbi:hypothetical protein Mapa_014364 [Marchantia paleacea]|nr:hypothetical protein Mapa_014364 [Marchantia paleacea]
MADARSLQRSACPEQDKQQQRSRRKQSGKRERREQSCELLLDSGSVCMYSLGKRGGIRYRPHPTSINDRSGSGS